jgi:hypothetical protein
MWSVPRNYNQDNWSNEFSREFCTGGYEESTWGRKAEESSLLEAVIKGTAGEDTAGWKRISRCCGDL